MKRLLLPALLFTTLTACTAAPADTLPFTEEPDRQRT